MDIQYRSMTSFLPILMAKSVVQVKAAIDYEVCSDQNQCFGWPKGEVWPKGGTSLRISRENIDVELMLARPMSPNVYAAMAFSDDQKMGNDLVFACGRNWINKESNGVNAFWNPSIGSDLLKEEIFKNASSSYVDETLTCKFTLEKNVTVKETLFDFRKGYHILLAIGLAGKPKLNKHIWKRASNYKLGNRGDQAVDCIWEVVEVGECSKSCDGGERQITRQRKVEASHGGYDCEGPSNITESCNVEGCPVDCQWGNWIHGECSKTCGDGIQTNQRKKITEAIFGGEECEGEATEEKECNVQECLTAGTNKQTTMANFSSTEGKSTSKITTLENKPTTKGVTGEEKATGLATNHFLSIIAISIMFVPFFLNA